MKTIRLLIFLSGLLFSISTNAQTEEIFYRPKLPQVEMGEAKATLARILMKTGNVNHPKLIHIKDYGNPMAVSVFEDRIEMTVNPKNITFYFSGLRNYVIQIIEVKHPDWSNYEAFSNYEIRLGKLEFLLLRRPTETSSMNLKSLADYFFYFQHQTNIKLYDSLLVAFKPIATQYNTLKVKPTVTEEQRKYIVQANGFNEQKMYDKAIELYIKAIKVDQTTFPAVYLNLALLSAQVNYFDTAIYYMKKYLLFEPLALDARGAQDKIYEWKAQLAK